MRKKLTVKDFLVAQEQPRYLCIIRLDKTDAKRVKLTRWIERKNICNFLQNIIVDLETIKFIYPTAHFTFIGAKKFAVVEVVFKKNAMVPITDLISVSWKEGIGTSILTGTKTIEEILRNNI